MSTEDQKGLWQITTMPKVDDVDTATNYANNGGSSWYVTSNCQNVELAEDFLASTFGSSTEFYDTILLIFRSSQKHRIIMNQENASTQQL